ncbi:MAG TPA: 50S ribosomal protein L6, partial [Acholeplasma sp.]|nr:50S ribosomal protein L6 [Acholeplasma sp.]
MSRIGNKSILVPSGVTVTISDANIVTVKGPKGTLEQQFNEVLDIKLEDNQIVVKRPDNEIFTRKIHGTTRALLQNMITGVTEGFKKQLEIRGVGYRAQLQGKKLVLQLGFSHNVEVEIPANINVEVPKNTDIIISGIDKAAVGQFAAEIRAFKKPEPYKG